MISVRWNFSFGELVRWLRKSKGYSCRCLAYAIGKSPGYISRIEQHNEIPSPQTVGLLSVVLGEKRDLFALAKRDKIEQVKYRVEKKYEEILKERQNETAGN